MNSFKLVLLCGMPRSGTTWIAKLFDSHKDTNYLHEPDSVEPAIDTPLLLNQGGVSEGQLEDKVRKWLKPSAEKVIASRPFFKKSYMNLFQWLLFLFSANAGKISAKLKLPMFKKPLRIHSTAPMTVWKTIESLGRTAVIHKLTNAHIIQIIRHPCGQIASTFRGERMNKFDSSGRTSEDWDLFDKLIKQSGEERFTLDDIKKMLPEERLAFRWGVMNDFALQRTAESKSIVLIYEDLCRDPKGKISEVFQSVGLTLEKETLNYLNKSTSGHEAAYYATKKTPLIAAYKWRDELSKEQQQRIAQMIKHFDSGKYYVDDF